MNWVSAADLDRWGWRIPFLVGAALAASVWIARSTMEESPDFERQQASGTVPRNPLRFTLTHHRAGIARGFAISALGSITYYVGITYVPAFLNAVGAVGESQALRLSTIAAVAVILVTPLTGALSDRFGRKPVLMFLCGGSAVLPVMLFYADGAGLSMTRLAGRGHSGLRGRRASARWARWRPPNSFPAKDASAAWPWAPPRRPRSLAASRPMWPSF